MTVIADDGLMADALSTAIFASGIDKGMGYLKRLPEAEAVLMDSYHDVYYTKGLQGSFLGVGGIRTRLI